MCEASPVLILPACCRREKYTQKRTDIERTSGQETESIMAVRAQFENSNELVLPLSFLPVAASSHLRLFYVRTMAGDEALRALVSEASECDCPSSLYWNLVLKRCSIRVGVFATLTNSYAVVAIGASENFYRCVIWTNGGMASRLAHERLNDGEGTMADFDSHV